MLKGKRSQFLLFTLGIVFVFSFLQIKDTSAAENDFVIKGDVLFDYNGKDENVVIPDNIKEIGEDAFFECKTLKTVTMNKELKKIGENAFKGCINLKNVTFMEGLEEIGEEAFEDCKSLKNVTLKKGLKKIQLAAFDNCTNLETVQLPEGLLRLNGTVFANCKKLKSIQLPESLIHIGSYTFQKCIRLKTIRIPQNVKNIEYTAFGECSNLTKFQVDKFNNYFATEGGILYDKKKTRILSYPASKKGQTFKVSNRVKQIDGYAFSNSKYLVSLTFPSSIEDFGERVISGCKKLKNLKLEEGLDNVEASVFSGCKSIKEIVLPASWGFVGEFPFLGCTRLEKITVNKNNKAYYSIDGVLYNKKKTVLECYPEGRKAKSYTIPPKVIAVEDLAFAGNKYIQKIYLPSSFKSYFGEGVFAGCTALRYIYMKGKVTYDPEGEVFSGCSRKLKIVINNKKLSLKDYMKKYKY